MQPQWAPAEQDIAAARITDFARFVTSRTDREFSDYRSLWQWSVDDPTGFWGAVWDYFDLGERSGKVLADARMPGAQWFPDTRVNYVDQVVRQAHPNRPAIVYATENGGLTEVSWAELLGRTAGLARTLRALGVCPGDRVVGYLPNIPEAVIAFLATASIGAIWSACGQDYSAKATGDRLSQLEPVVLVTADGYRYGGKAHDKREEIATLRAGLPTVKTTVLVSRLESCGVALSGEELSPAGVVLGWEEATADTEAADLTVESVDFGHPLWVLYSSGTTGLPKGIVHGHGGVVVEHVKTIALQLDIAAGDVFFWYTSPSWMMWNFQIAGLLVGATIVCYDGSPTSSTVDRLWDIAARTRATVLGTSPGYVLACIKANTTPRADHDLSALRTVGVTGSVLPPTSSVWLRDNIGERVQVSSISGGTDVVSAFIGGVRTVPVWPGELSAPFLGVALDAWDETGRPVRGHVGELVITAPMPSMPVMFWNDPDGFRYHEAYFGMFPGIWRHGDWITLTDHGSVIVHGRSDSTVNRHGVRMGSADIYQVVERLPEISEALVIGVEQPDGGYWMPLFVVLADDAELTDELKHHINAVICAEASPRHVPDDIIATPGIPHTRTGKKLEIPIKKLFQGADPTRVMDPTAVDDPTLLGWYATYTL